MKRPGFRLHDALETSGGVAIVAGVAMVNVPASVILGGVLVVVWANVRDMGRSDG